jgi:hypothetical protein
LELIEENGMEILGNTVKDLIKEKHDGEPIIIKFQDPFINASKFINFLGVENFDFVYNPLLVNVANQLKVDEKKFYVMLSLEYKVGKLDQDIYI